MPQAKVSSRCMSLARPCFCGGEPGWPAVLLRRVTGGQPDDAASDHPDLTISLPHIALIAVALWLVVQIVLPVRGAAFSSEIRWSGDDHRFSWRMRIYDRQAVPGLHRPDGRPCARRLGPVRHRSLGSAAEDPGLGAAVPDRFRIPDIRPCRDAPLTDRLCVIKSVVRSRAPSPAPCRKSARWAGSSAIRLPVPG